MILGGPLGSQGGSLGIPGGSPLGIPGGPLGRLALGHGPMGPLGRLALWTRAHGPRAMGPGTRNEYNERPEHSGLSSEGLSTARAFLPDH